MSRFIATSAIRGAKRIVEEADAKLKEALETLGPNAKVEFTNTAYYLPIIYAYTAHPIEKLGDIVPTMEYIKGLLPPWLPSERLWLPYLGETLDAGVATLFAEEIYEAIEFAKGNRPQKRADGYVYNGPIDDIQLRAWGIQLVDGRMPGFAAIIGCARTNEAAVRICRELQQRNILVFLSGNINGRSIIDQLLEEGVELGYGTFTVPFGPDTISTSYALGFASRSALTFGGYKPGQGREHLLYNRSRVHAFAIALGEVDDLKYATAAGAITYGFPAIADTIIPNIMPTGITRYEHVVSMPWDDIAGKDDTEKADLFVQRCIEIRGLRLHITKVDIPVSYGAAFEGEVVRRADLQVEFGGRGGHCFEYLRMLDMDEVQDGRFTVVGPDMDDFPVGSQQTLALVVEVAGRRMQKEFEPVLERQFHYFLNAAEGFSHQGQREISWFRLHKNLFNKGFRLAHIGTILHARLHADFGTIVEKVQVTCYTDPVEYEKWLKAAQEAYEERTLRAAELTDESVDTYYSCILCQAYAPTHVCIINPERVGLCGAYGWLDCRASYEINPTGPNQPVTKGRVINTSTGEWEGVNAAVQRFSGGGLERMTLYSLMDAPMSSCGCFESIMMLLPEVNGVMIVAREDLGQTPCGMTFSGLAGICGGGFQTPGMMGMGKYYILSKKFISHEGGIGRLVWLSKNIKEQYAAEIAEVCASAGLPDLPDKIADGDSVTTLEELIAWCEEKQHPALTMPSMVG